MRVDEVMKVNEVLKADEIAASSFSEGLLHWYDRAKRDLPWRRSRDPYAIWVSEIMLQQTRVDTVIPYYERFMAHFPTVQALAEAPEGEVLKCWEGLGYYSRARNLQAGARQVMERHQGKVPDDADAVAALKGVGPYTKGAIMSIAFNKPEPAVDGNVMRVLSRYFCLEDDIARPATRPGMERLAASLIPEGRAGDFNQAIMELGAMICTPKSPGCLICPVMQHCEGRQQGRAHELPLKTKAKRPRPEQRLVALIEGTGEYQGKVLIRQRPQEGLLAGLWELPHVVAGDHDARARQLAVLLGAQTGLWIKAGPCWLQTEHIFSHLIWQLEVYRGELGTVLTAAERQRLAESIEPLLEDNALVAEEQTGYGTTTSNNGTSVSRTEAFGTGNHAYEVPMRTLPTGYCWIGPEDVKRFAFPAVFVRILEQYWGKPNS